MATIIFGFMILSLLAVFALDIKQKRMLDVKHQQLHKK